MPAHRPYRKGQWISTSLAVIGAHKAPDGRTVGIYQPAKRQVTPATTIAGKATEPKVTYSPARVVIVSAEDGHDLYALQGREAKPVVFDADALPDLEPVCEADHLPESRRSHLPAGMKLPA